MFKRKTANLLTLTLLGVGTLSLTACSVGGKSSGSSDPFASLNTAILVQPTAAVLVGQEGVLEFEVTNTTASTLTIGAAASANAVSIVDMQDRIPASPDYTVTIQDPATVGAGAGCWSPSQTEGATLQPNQSCVQFVSFTSNTDGATVEGGIDVQLSAQGQTKQVQIPINATFKAVLDPEYAASLDFATAMVWRPFSDIQLSFNNTSDNNAINGLTIDLSYLFDQYPDLYALIDFSDLPHGFVYDNATHTIVLATLAAGGNKVLSLLLGAAQDIFTDPDIVTALSNNDENNPFIKLSGANLTPVYPIIEIDNQLAQANVSEIKMTTNASITLSAFDGVPDIDITDITNLPNGVTYAVSGCDTGICSVAFTAAADADPTPATITIEYEAGGVAFTLDLPFQVDTTTALTSNDTVILHRKTETSGERISYVTVTNGGDFNTTIPADINDAFVITSTQSTVGLEIIDSSCAGTILAPNATCQIGIKSTSHTTPTGNFTLRTKAQNNLVAANVTVMNLQSSVDGFDISVTEPLPTQTNAAKPIYFTATITNTDAVSETIKAINLPTGATLTPTAENTCTVGQTLAQNDSCILAYEITGGAGDTLSGHFEVIFESQTAPTHDVTWESENISTQFVASGSLASNVFTVTPMPIFAPDTTLSFTVANTGNQPIQRLALDFNTMSADLRDQLDFTNITGGTYDAATHTITYNDGVVLANDTHTFTVKIKDTAEAQIQANYNQLRDNATSGYIKITSQNTQSQNPTLAVNVTPMTFSTETLSFADTTAQTITVTNTTNHAFNVGLDQDTSTASQVVPVFNDTLPAGSTLTITVTPDADAPKQTNKTLAFVFGDGDTEYTQNVTVNVDGTELVRANTNSLNVLRPADANPITTNVSLGNAGGFTVLSTDLTDLFEVQDSNGDAVSIDDIEIVAPTNGGDSCLGVPSGQVCAVGIQVKNPNPAVGTYTLHTKADANVDAANIATFTLIATHTGYSFTPTVLLPVEMLTDSTATYTATFTNDSADSYEIKAVTLPTTDATIDYPAGPGTRCWNGTTGATLATGQTCSLIFTITSVDDTYLIGDLQMQVQDTTSGMLAQVIEEDAFNTIIAADATQAFVSTSLTLSPAHDTVITVGGGDQVVNNLRLNFDNLPQAVYDEIQSVSVDGNAKTLNKNGMGLGTLAAQPLPHTITIRMKNTAGTALADNQPFLESPANNSITLQAANIAETAQIISVIPEVLNISDVTLTNTTEQNVTVTNSSNQAITIGNLTGGLANVTARLGTCDIAGIKTLAANSTCTLNFTATNQAFGSDTYTLSYTGSNGNNLTQDFTVTIADTTATVVLESDSVTRATPTGEVPSYEITVTNTGNFALRSDNWANIFTLSDANMTIANSNCTTALDPSAICTAELQVPNAVATSNQTITLEKGNFSNLNADNAYTFAVSAEAPSIILEIQDGEGNWQVIGEGGITLVTPEPSFTDNGDGTITEIATGLLWIQNANTINGGTPLDWATAIDTCEAMDTGNYAWRLPSKDELEAIVNLKQAETTTITVVGTWLNDTYGFQNILNNWYWTGTENGSNAWAVNFNDGLSGEGAKSSGGFSRAWCVSDGGPYVPPTTSIQCPSPDYSPGDTITVDGQDYLVVANTGHVDTDIRNPGTGVIRDDVRSGDQKICTTQVTDMSYLFWYVDFDGDISNWDTSNVADFDQLFRSSNFDGDISHWDVSNVTNMSGVFLENADFNQDISNWDTSSVTNMWGMFSDAVAFNQDISSWNTSSVSNMDIMFKNASSFNQDLSGWCVGDIASEPTDFDIGATAWTMDDSRPIWGTCPE